MLHGSVKVLKKVVLTNLAKHTISNPSKTYAEAMIDGSITEVDLRAINSVKSFPNNNFNKFNLAEGEYRSMDAMQDFVALIGEHLSDAALYHVTHTLAKIEVTGDNTEAYRQSTLAKYFALYEAKRHDSYDNERRASYCSTTTSNPVVFLSHMHEFVLPLAKRIWKNLEITLPTYVSFNLKFKLEIKNIHAEITEFPKLEFDVRKLDTKSPADAFETAKFITMVKSVSTEESKSVISSEPVTSPAPVAAPRTVKSLHLMEPKPAMASEPVTASLPTAASVAPGVQSSLDPAPVSGPLNFRLMRSYSVSGPVNFRPSVVSANVSTLFAAQYHRIQLEMAGKLHHLYDIAGRNSRIIQANIDEIQKLRSRLLQLKDGNGGSNDTSALAQIRTIELTIAERSTTLTAMEQKHNELLHEIENRKAALLSLEKKMGVNEAGNADKRSSLRRSS